MKKLAVSLFLLMINSSLLLAFETKVTQLSDHSFAPLPTWADGFQIYWGLIGSEPFVTKRGRGEQVAIITLRFGVDEIGGDFSAAEVLGKKECAKLGADWTFLLFVTEYSGTKQIASVTFLCARSNVADKIFTREEFETSAAREELLKFSVFFKKLHEDRRNSPKELDTEGFLEGFLKRAGIRVQHIKTKDNKSKDLYFDLKTGKRLSEEEVAKRFNGNLEENMVNELLPIFADEFVSVHKENSELYKSEYDQIAQIMRKYPNSNFNLNFPKIDSEGNIDYQKLRGDFISMMTDLLKDEFSAKNPD